jgi:putative ABC transport system permease protein
MAAVWTRVRSDLRNRWRAWALLGLVVGVLAGAVLTAAAGARRADSAYPRFVKRYNAFDVQLGGISTDDPTEAARIRKEIIAFPEVADYSTSEFVSGGAVMPSGLNVSFPDMIVVGDPAGHELFTVNKAKVLSGRLFRLDAVDEGVVDFNTADRFKLHVGDRVGIPLGDPRAGPQKVVEVRIVGIAVAPGSMPAVGAADLAGIQVSPAFVHAHAKDIPPSTDAPALRLKRGSADLPSLLARVKELGAGIDVPQTLPSHLKGVQKTLGFEVQALWILSGLIALAGIAIFGQAISRQINSEADDNPVLVSIGMTPKQLMGVGLLRVTGIAFLAAVAAAITAIVASPLTPIGLTRLVEPNPGIRIDPLVVFGGAGIVFVVVLLISALPVIRTARAPSRASDEVPSRPSRAASLAAGSGAGPTTVTGLRLAFETGRGSRSVPVRSALLGLALAVSSFAAAGTFTASLDHLIATPSLYGYGWDFITLGDSTAQTLKALQPDPDIEAISPGGASNIRIGTTRLIPLTYEPGRGISPTMLEGRPPVTADEIALGTSLFRSLHTRIGATVNVQIDSESNPSPRLPMRVVGRTVVPTFFFQAVEPGQSSAITMDGLQRLLGATSAREDQGGVPLIVRYKKGTDVETKLANLQKKIPGLFTIQVRRAAAELSAVSRSSGVPLTLTEVLLFMAVATLVHVLVTSVRKRRRDLAILKTIGFVRRQVRGAVAWQATSLIVVALAIGLPVGIATGRWIWTAFAGSIGVVPAPSVRLVLVLLAIPSAIIAANLIAAFPGRAAARTKPALVLRAE